MARESGLKASPPTDKQPPKLIEKRRCVGGLATVYYNNIHFMVEAIRRAEVRKELVNLIVATINRLNSKIATCYALGTNTTLVTSFGHRPSKV